MADKGNNGWEKFVKSGLIKDYLAYKGSQSGACAPAVTPDTQTGYTGRATDGGETLRYNNSRD